MKKIGLFACASIAFSIAASAASASWNWYSYDGMSASAGVVYANATTPLYNQMGAASIYLIDAAVTSQGNLLSGMRAAESASAYWGSITKADSTALGADSKIDDKSFTYGTSGQAYNFYYAIFDSANNKLLMSESVGGTAYESGEFDLDFTSASDASKLSFGTAAYGSAGWYAVTVPEPFSGTLALLGMIGIGLRRKLKKQKKA